MSETSEGRSVSEVRTESALVVVRLCPALLRSRDSLREKKSSTSPVLHTSNGRRDVVTAAAVVTHKGTTVT